jgi:hypothetical protein
MQNPYKGQFQMGAIATRVTPALPRTGYRQEVGNREVEIRRHLAGQI